MECRVRPAECLTAFDGEGFVRAAILDRWGQRHFENQYYERRMLWNDVPRTCSL